MTSNCFRKGVCDEFQIVLGGNSPRAGARRLLGRSIQMLGDENYIAVVGVGKQAVIPDSATFTFTLRERGQTSAEVSAAISKNASEVVDALQEFGVEEEQITTRNFTVSEDFKEINKSGRFSLERDGFVARYTLIIQIADFQKIGDVMAKLTTSFSGELGRLEYHVSNRNAALETARENALSDARQKAKQYAEGASRTLGKTVIVEESRIGMFRLRPELKQKNASGQAIVFDQARAAERNAPLSLATNRNLPEIPILPAPVEITVNLYVKHEIL